MGGSTGNLIKRGVTAGVTGGLSEFARKDPFGGVSNPLGLPTVYRKLGGQALGGEDQPPAISGPFSLDPAQVEENRNAILNLGNQQFTDTQKFIDQDMTNRAASREALAKALTTQAQASFQQGLPSTLEDLNARHLLNGSGLGQELGRQQGQIATDIANQVGVQGTQDLDLASQQRMAALQGRQGVETGALQRGLSLEDFVNQANVSKSIGASFAPLQPNGKQNFGTVAQGLGALSPFAKLGKTPAVAPKA